MIQTHNVTHLSWVIGFTQFGEEGAAGAGHGLSDAELAAEEAAELAAVAEDERQAEAEQLANLGSGGGGRWYDQRQEEALLRGGVAGAGAFGRRYDNREGVAAGEGAGLGGRGRYDEDLEERRALGGRLRGAGDRVPEDADEEQSGR